MRFRDDTRGVTVQIGAVLLFATIIIVLATYQATVVPAQNADVEYQHSQQAQDQMTDVRNALLRTAGSGNAQPTSLALGTQYPSRVFLMNPPPAAGTLTTGVYENDTISVSNVNATDDETADFFEANGDAWSASTKYLAYQPGYHEYDSAPNLVFGGTMLSNHYPERNASVPLTDQLLVEGNTITLVALNGSLSTSRAGSVSVDATPVSAPYTAVQVEPENEGEPVNVTVPTHVDAATLRNATSLGGQENVSVVDAGEGRVTIQLSGDGPFTLQTAKLGVGSDVAGEGAAYLTHAESDEDSVTVEARDRFNNPVSGVRVNVSVEGVSSELTNARGRATFEYTGSGENATASILGGGSDELEVAFDEQAGPGSGGSRATLEWNTTRIESDNSGLGVRCWAGNDTCTYDRSGRGTDSVSLFAEFLDGRAYGGVDFAANNTTVVSGLVPSADDSDSAGAVVTTAEVSAPGTALVYAAGTADEDVLRLVANATGDGGAPTPTIDMRVDDLTHQSSNKPRFVTSYDLSNTNASFERVDVQFTDLDGSAGGTVQNAAQRGSVDFEPGYGAGHRYDVTVQVVYSGESGEYVAAQRSFSGVRANAENPAANDDLGSASSPQLASGTTFEDVTRTNQNQPIYRTDYTVDRPSTFDHVEFVGVSKTSGGMGAVTSTDTSGNNLEVSASSGANTPFKVSLLVFDDDGVVVDVKTVTDTADGEGP